MIDKGRKKWSGIDIYGLVEVVFGRGVSGVIVLKLSRNLLCKAAGLKRIHHLNLEISSYPAVPGNKSESFDRGMGSD